PTRRQRREGSDLLKWSGRSSIRYRRGRFEAWELPKGEWLQQIELLDQIHDETLDRINIEEYPLSNFIERRHYFLTETSLIDSFFYLLKSSLDIIPKILNCYYPACIDKNRPISKGKKKRQNLFRELDKINTPLSRRIKDDYPWMHLATCYRDLATHNDLIVSDCVALYFDAKNLMNIDEKLKFNYQLGLVRLQFKDLNENISKIKWEYKGKDGKTKKCDLGVGVMCTLIDLFSHFKDLMNFMFKELFEIKINDSEFNGRLSDIFSKYKEGEPDANIISSAYGGDIDVIITGNFGKKIRTLKDIDILLEKFYSGPEFLSYLKNRYKNNHV
ncbi:MAG: hypothetical protein WBD09_08695, partial [Halobacteriota archaeon]